eukprot:gene40632-49061_t
MRVTHDRESLHRGTSNASRSALTGKEGAAAREGGTGSAPGESVTERGAKGAAGAPSSEPRMDKRPEKEAEADNLQTAQAAGRNLGTPHNQRRKTPMPAGAAAGRTSACGARRGRSAAMEGQAGGAEGG